MLHRTEAQGIWEAIAKALFSCGMKMPSLTNKKSGLFFGNRAMLLTNNH